jgi:hypothetical protein
MFIHFELGAEWLVRDEGMTASSVNTAEQRSWWSMHLCRYVHRTSDGDQRRFVTIGKDNWALHRCAIGAEGTISL